MILSNLKESKKRMSKTGGIAWRRILRRAVPQREERDETF